MTNSVTANASQPALQPDSVVFSVAVTSGHDQTVEDIENAVSGLGITAANLTGLGMPDAVLNHFGPLPRSGPPQGEWTFQLVVPFPQIKSTSAALAALQKSFAQSTSGLMLSWSVTACQSDLCGTYRKGSGVSGIYKYILPANFAPRPIPFSCTLALPYHLL